MSRKLVALAAVAAVVFAFLLVGLEGKVEPLWPEARKYPLAAMWTARWPDLFAQLLLTVAVIVAVSYFLPEVGSRWESSTPTQ